MNDQNNGRREKKGNTEAAGIFGSREPFPGAVQTKAMAELLGLAAYGEGRRFEADDRGALPGRVDLVDEVRSRREEDRRWEVRIETACPRGRHAVLAPLRAGRVRLRRVVGAMRVNASWKRWRTSAENPQTRPTKAHPIRSATPFFQAQRARGRVDGRSSRAA